MPKHKENPASLPIGRGVCGNCNDGARRPLYANPLGGKPVCGGCVKELREEAVQPEPATRATGLRTRAEGRCVRLEWEPGDATRYEAILAESGGRTHLVLLSPSKGAMGLPDYWRKGLNAFYVGVKLDVNDHTAEEIVAAVATWLAGRP